MSELNGIVGRFPVQHLQFTRFVLFNVQSNRAGRLLIKCIMLYYIGIDVTRVSQNGVIPISAHN